MSMSMSMAMAIVVGHYHENCKTKGQNILRGNWPLVLQCYFCFEFEIIFAPFNAMPLYHSNGTSHCNAKA